MLHIHGAVIHLSLSVLTRPATKLWDDREPRLHAESWCLAIAATSTLWGDLWQRCWKRLRSCKPGDVEKYRMIPTFYLAQTTNEVRNTLDDFRGILEVPLYGTGMTFSGVSTVRCRASTFSLPRFRSGYDSQVQYRRIDFRFVDNSIDNVLDFFQDAYLSHRWQHWKWNLYQLVVVSEGISSQPYRCIVCTNAPDYGAQTVKPH